MQDLVSENDKDIGRGSTEDPNGCFYYGTSIAQILGSNNACRPAKDVQRNYVAREFESTQCGTEGFDMYGSSKSYRIDNDGKFVSYLYERLDSYEGDESPRKQSLSTEKIGEVEGDPAYNPSENVNFAVEEVGNKSYNYCRCECLDGSVYATLRPNGVTNCVSRENCTNGVVTPFTIPTNWIKTRTYSSVMCARRVDANNEDKYPYDIKHNKAKVFYLPNSTGKFYFGKCYCHKYNPNGELQKPGDTTESQIEYWVRFNYDPNEDNTASVDYNETKKKGPIIRSGLKCNGPNSNSSIQYQVDKSDSIIPRINPFDELTFDPNELTFDQSRHNIVLVNFSQEGDTKSPLETNGLKFYEEVDCNYKPEPLLLCDPKNPEGFCPYNRHFIGGIDKFANKITMGSTKKKESMFFGVCKCPNGQFHYVFAKEQDCTDASCQQMDANGVVSRINVHECIENEDKISVVNRSVVCGAPSVTDTVHVLYTEHVDFKG